MVRLHTFCPLSLTYVKISQTLDSRRYSFKCRKPTAPLSHGDRLRLGLTCCELCPGMFSDLGPELTCWVHCGSYSDEGRSGDRLY